ncbi:hypothetical protein E2C01_005477 [Portunus trituberculatus]|uniref:Uncharacterized protein n=1 Tax=Portunus trituberculatus TaxID=210409 RepID=A0A5B7CTN0_PORTR|nr:hypothetical protein [Portunus trituberculatus]
MNTEATRLHPLPQLYCAMRVHPIKPNNIPSGEGEDFTLCGDVNKPTETASTTVLYRFMTALEDELLVIQPIPYHHLTLAATNASHNNGSL